MYILIPIASGGWDAEYDQILNSRERAQIRALQDLKMAHLEMPTERTNCCVFRKSILYVSANGNVTPCAFVPYVLARIKEHSLALIWKHHTGAFRGSGVPGGLPYEHPLLNARPCTRDVSRVARELGSGPSS